MNGKGKNDKGRMYPCTGRFCLWKNSCQHYVKYMDNREKYQRRDGAFIRGDRTTECIGENQFKEYIATCPSEDMRRWRES